MNQNPVDEQWMALALREARRGLYSSSPNPRVGCAIVRDGHLLSSGYHALAGGPHAEIDALKKMDGDATGATVYVTLEPCSHTGRTPPCADALIAAGPARVVAAMQDPNPRVGGGGLQKLREHDIEVDCGVLEPQARALNAGFIKRMQRGLPLLRLKMAASLDGRTALANGLSQWITGDAARLDVHRLRAASCAVLSTAKTVLKDDASLNVRLGSDQFGGYDSPRQPVRVILDSQLLLGGKERLFELPGDIWIFTLQDTENCPSGLQRDNVRLLRTPPDEQGGIDLLAVLRKLAELEINEVHSECGATLGGALLQQQLVDELVLYLAPTLMGAQARGLFELGEISIMSDKLPLSITDIRLVGEDIRITARTESSCLPSL